MASLPLELDSGRGNAHGQAQSLSIQHAHAAEKQHWHLRPMGIQFHMGATLSPQQREAALEYLIGPAVMPEPSAKGSSRKIPNRRCLEERW